MALCHVASTLQLTRTPVLWQEAPNLDLRQQSHDAGESSMTLSENEGASLEGVHTQTWSCNESWDQCVHQILPRDEESNLESRAKKIGDC